MLGATEIMESRRHSDPDTAAKSDRKYIDFIHGERLLSEYVKMHMEEDPNKAVVIFYGREMSWRNLEEWSNSLANGLAGHGYTKGDRIAVYLQSCPQCYVIYLAALKLGMIVVPIDPMHKELELEYALNDSSADLVVTQDQLYQVVRNVRDKCKFREVMVTSFHDFMPDTPAFPFHPMMLAEKQTFPNTLEYLDFVETYPTNSPEVDVRLSDDAWILYTGGTSGFPKGCLHTHFNTLLGGAGVTHLQLDATRNDIMITAVPHTHMYGLAMGIATCFYCGYTVIVMARWDATAALQAIHKYRPTKLAWPMPCITSIIDHPDRDKYDLTSFTTCNVAAFVLPYTVEIAERWKEITGCRLDNFGYAIGTETFQYCACGGLNVPFKDPVAVGIGRISPGVEIKIVDFKTREQLPVGGRGEIVIKTPSQLKCYINKPDVNRRDIVDGWLYSGDIGTIKDDGLLYFYGRHRDVIKVSGYTLAPREIEILGMANPAIDKIAVLGVPHVTKGEVPKAYITLKPGYRLSAKELVDWFKEKVAAYKVPLVEIRETLPISNKGEVLRRTLKEEEQTKSARG